MLFVSAKINQYANLPQGQVEHSKRVKNMVARMDDEGFGAAPAPQLIFPFFESEMIDAYEFGVKSDFLDKRMRANISAFSYDYENLQFQSTDPDVYRGGVANIPKSEMKGIELELIGSISES